MTFRAQLIRITCWWAVCLSLAGAAAPRIAVDAPHFNFGEQPNHLTIEHTFEVRNDGDGLLKIERIRSSCGCTVGAVSSYEVAPGETATITARYRLIGRRGNQHSVLTLETNDPVTPRQQLIMSGYALHTLQIQPAHLFFGSLTAGTTRAQTVELRGAANRPFEITNVTLDGEGFTWGEPMERGRSHYALTVTAHGGTKPGVRVAELKLETSHPDHPVIAIPLRAEIAGPLTVAPSSMMLMKQPDRPVTRFVVVRPGTVQDFEITEVVPPRADVDVQITRMGADGYRIQLSNLRGSPELTAHPLRIHTTVDAMPVIEVPFELIE